MEMMREVSLQERPVFASKRGRLLASAPDSLPVRRALLMPVPPFNFLSLSLTLSLCLQVLAFSVTDSIQRCRFP